MKTMRTILIENNKGESLLEHEGQRDGSYTRFHLEKHSWG